MSVFAGRDLPPTLRPTLLASSLALALSAISAFPAVASTSPTPSLLQAQHAVTSVRSMALGLGMRNTDQLQVRNSMVNAQGRTIVRADQTFNGHRVWGSSAVIHVEAGGSPRIAQQGLTAGSAPTGSPVLSQAKAIEIAQKAMNLKGASLPAQAELVVFPTKYLGGIKMNWDESKGQYSLDRKFSVVTKAPSEANVWAYEVRTSVRNPVDGLQKLIYVIDAKTGAILKVSNGLQHLATPNPPTPDVNDVAVKGTGYSQYEGTVVLDTVRHSNGSYGLIDTTRGSKYNPFMHDVAVDYDFTPFLDANGNPPSYIGLQTFTDTHEGFGGTFKQSSYWYDGFFNNNIWGDGHQFLMFPYGHEADSNGQTTAVDAHHGMGIAWDFYKFVFGRDGIDGLGTSVFANVHLTDYGTYYDNASWDSFSLGMFFSDGSKNDMPDPATGALIPGNPSGFNSLTSIDIIGHEMTHGITGFTANLFYDDESGGMNEATSDIFGSLIEAYAKRAPGTDDQIPLTGNNWLIGEKINDSPLRDMEKPSLDHYSTDIWFDGMNALDVHYTSGPLNRWFVMLSKGASSVPGDKSYSAYLPGGMTGIGNDHAGRIWYKALTECMVEFSTYEVARICGVAAASDLYGPNSADVVAVRKAFAAINVGNPTDEEKPRIRVYANQVHPWGSALNTGGGDYFLRVPIIAMGYPVQASATVTGTENTAVTWTIGGLTGRRHTGGTISADGRWTPNHEFGMHTMTVTSVADPLQYAELNAMVVNGDADGDNDFDAIDLGGVALSWGLYGGWVEATHGIMGGGFTDSSDVLAIVEAFKNAFGGA